MVMCFAIGCSHRPPRETCSFFRFPKEKNKFKQWRDMCRRLDSEPNCFSRLCSCHFVDGLKSNGPTLFSYNKEKQFKFTSPEKRPIRRKKICPVVPGTSGVSGTTDSPGTWQIQEQPSTSSGLPCVVDEEVKETPPNLEEEINQLKARVYFLEKELAREKSENSNTPGNTLSYSMVKTDFKLFHYYTGLPDYNAFNLLIALLSDKPLTYYENWVPQKMSLESQLFLTLVKLRLNFDFTDLAVSFQVSRTTVRNVFLTIVYALHSILFPLIKMPSTRKNKTCLPSSFSNFSNCKCIVDCTEIVCAVPRTSLPNQSRTFSHYKQRNTFKALVACSPHGAITFVSEVYPGSLSDKAIFKECGIIKHFVQGDLVLADKGFLISDLLPPGVSVNIPPFLKNRQLTEAEARVTTEIARARIHIERVIGRMKHYNILDLFPANVRQHSSVIFQLVACLINLHHPLCQTMDLPDMETDEG